MKLVRLSSFKYQVVLFMMHLTSQFVSLVYISLALFHTLEYNTMSETALSRVFKDELLTGWEQ